MKKLVILSLLTALFLFTSCSHQSSESNSDYTAFLKLLTEHNFSYTQEEIDTSSYLSVSRKPVMIGDEIISVYQYDSIEDMEKDAAYIDQGGCSISTPEKQIQISWSSFPHFFKKGTLIINYVGENEEILNLLNESYGPEFAGYGFITSRQ